MISTSRVHEQGMSISPYYKGYGPLNVQAYSSLNGCGGYHYCYSDGYVLGYNSCITPLYHFK